MRWLLAAVGGAATLIVLAVLVVYAVSGCRIGKTNEFASTSVPVPSDSASIARGARIARIHGCSGCHGRRLEGGILVEAAFMGRLVAPTLTRVREVYSDRDFVRFLLACIARP